MGHDHNHSEHCECKPSAAAQSLDEMDFERGIWSAALYNDVERLKKFTETGHANDVDATGYTALHYAARSGHSTICEYLLAAGADVNVCTRSGGVSPLQRCSYMGHLEIVQLLLRNGADIFHQDSDGNTALHKAAQNRHHSIMKTLLDSASEPTRLEAARNKRGQTAKDILE